MIPWTDATIALDQVDEPAAPLRESIDTQALGDLADDIAVNGLLQPIGARGPSPDGRYECVWGHRRMLAARMLQWPTIPARLCPWPTDPALARLAENMMRTDLNPREEAGAISALRGRGQSISAIARILRRSVGWVEARIDLLTWPKDVQDLVARGELAMSAARLLCEIDHDSYRTTLIDEVRRTGATAPVISVWVAHYTADRDRIIRNAETVEQIVSRREAFTVLFTCECCAVQQDTRLSVLLRVCTNCARTLEEEKRNDHVAPT
jgi:ParB/RepB/Spo0J family partition protein